MLSDTKHDGRGRGEERGGGEGGHVIDKCKSCTYEYHHHDAKIVETAAEAWKLQLILLSWWLARHGGERQATEAKATEDADLACVYTCTCVCICIHTYVYLVEIALDALGQGREGGGGGGAAI